MVAIDIEFEEEEKNTSTTPKKEEPGPEDISLEFSASTELINLAAMRQEEKSQDEKDPAPSGQQDLENIKAQAPSESSAPKAELKAEISEEMKAVVNKVKAEAAKVRSLDDARQKKPAPAQAAPQAPAQRVATPQPKAPVRAPAPSAPVIQGATALQSDIFSETRNLPLLEKLDPMTKVEVEAEIRVAKAETRGEVMGYYLSEAKLLEYQIITLLKRLPVKTQEEVKILQQIQKRLSDHTKKKPSF